MKFGCQACVGVCLFLIAMTTAGCDSFDSTKSSAALEDFGGTSIVSGTVTLDGEPVESAKLVFIPEKLMGGMQSFRPLAFSTTDSSGLYSLQLGDGSEKIPTGRYRVLISKRGSKTIEKPSITGGQFADLLTPFKLGMAVSGEPNSGNSAARSPDSPEAPTPKSFDHLREKIGLYEMLPAEFNRDSELKATVDGIGAETKIDFQLSFDGQ
jgi:hypothetical protein